VLASKRHPLTFIDFSFRQDLRFGMIQSCMSVSSFTYWFAGQALRMSQWLVFCSKEEKHVHSELYQLFYTDPSERTNATALTRTWVFSHSRKCDEPKIKMGSGYVDDKSRSYIACRLLSSLVTVPRSYGMGITACPGFWDSSSYRGGPYRCVTSGVAVEPRIDPAPT
jgi:hypothetical protein